MEKTEDKDAIIAELREANKVLLRMYEFTMKLPRTKTLKEKYLQVIMSIVEHNIQCNKYDLCTIIKRGENDFIAVLSEFDKNRMP